MSTYAEPVSQGVRQDVAGDSPPIDPSLFRRAAGRFATGICVVTTRAGELDHAMTVNAFTSVYLDRAHAQQTRGSRRGDGDALAGGTR